MPEGYEVSTSELRGHARSVRQVADTLGQAMDAARQVTLGVQAYGLICGPLFVPIVLGVSAPGLVALNLAQEAINSVADNIGKSAFHYEAVEQRNAQGFTAIKGEMS
jgi:hypothetical protein